MVSDRTSYVENIVVRNILSASNFQIGDSKRIHAKVNALAVQKEYPIFSGDEGDLSPFHIYFEPIPLPVVNERVNLNIENEVPIIKVRSVHLIALAAASTLHVGNTESIYTEARIKHFRRFFHIPPGYARTDQGPII